MSASLLIDLFLEIFMSDDYQMPKKPFLRCSFMSQKYLLWCSSTRKYSTAILSLFHIPDQACVFITKTGGEKDLSTPPPPSYHASFHHLLILQLGMKEEDNRKMITRGGEKLCGVFH